MKINFPTDKLTLKNTDSDSYLNRKFTRVAFKQ